MVVLHPHMINITIHEVVVVLHRNMWQSTMSDVVLLHRNMGQNTVPEVVVLNRNPRSIAQY